MLKKKYIIHLVTGEVRPTLVYSWAPTRVSPNELSFMCNGDRIPTPPVFDPINKRWVILLRKEFIFQWQDNGIPVGHKDEEEVIIKIPSDTLPKTIAYHVALKLKGIKK